MKNAGPIARRSVRGSCPSIHRSSDRPQTRADAARAVQHADAGSRAGADRKDPLAEDREQQQHAAREPPAGLDEHDRRDVRVPAEISDSFDEIVDPREREPS